MTARTMRKHLDEYAEVSRQITELEARKKALADKIKAGMDGAEEIECGGYVARNKAVTSSRFDSKRFKAANAALYASFCCLQTTQRFSVTAC